MSDIERELKVQEFYLAVEDAKRHFGQWDGCRPVVWAIVRVVQLKTTSRTPSD